MHTMPEQNFVDDDKQAVKKKIDAEFNKHHANWIDGLTVEFEDGSWFNIRPSNTESLLRLNAEAHSKKKLIELVEAITSAGGLD